jgi:pre-rRNA-processing protein TSR1
MTTFAPICLTTAPVLVFQELPDGRQSLLATGSLLSADPNRVVVKRAVLSGHPFHINKRVVTVRFMFFSREDVEWFKPVELRTKQGRRGHIKAGLGTHGHMKCNLDGQVTQQDAVLMHLYKRVFPKVRVKYALEMIIASQWTYDPHVADCRLGGPARQRTDSHQMEME